jgi:hypothetical protein
MVHAGFVGQTWALCSLVQYGCVAVAIEQGCRLAACCMQLRLLRKLLCELPPIHLMSITEL